MKQIVSQEVKEGRVTILYDNGDVVTMNLEPAPQDIVVDSEEVTEGGHSFTNQELKERGYA